MASTYMSASKGWSGGGGLGVFEPSPPLKLRAFIHTRRLHFTDYMHALHFALELLFIKKKLFEFHIFKRSIDFCQLTN